MIVVSLLLILAAVALLVLGLTGGSSALLTGSIVTSLLAAIALVIAARRAATRRQAAGTAGDAGRTRVDRPAGPGGTAAPGGPVDPDLSEPFAADGPFEVDRARAMDRSFEDDLSSASEHTAPFEAVGDERPVGSGRSVGLGRPAATGVDASMQHDESFAYSTASADPFAHGAEEDLQSGDFSRSVRITEDDRSVDPFAGEPDGRRAGAMSSGFRGVPGQPDSRFEPGSGGRDLDRDGEPASESRFDADEGPGVTQTLNPDHLANYRGAGSGHPGTAAGAERHEESWPAHGESDFSSSDDRDPDYHRASSLIGAARVDESEERGRHDSEVPVPLEEFGEPDEEDPADEPLPQAVRPHDAVQVARLTEEVLVVDGRPRYHLADCPHLVGRLTEGLPAAEAVELGFSPCGLCRPVDRLVARATQH